MPLSIVFNKDLESHFPIHENFLFRKACQPAGKVWKEAQEWNLDYYTLMNSKEATRTRDDLVPPRPLILWMYQFMTEVEEANDHEKFHFEFSYYMATSYCSGDDEFVSRASCPMWFCTISDFEGAITHKNWTIAFDDWADILIKRGPATSEDPMSNAPDFRHNKEMKSKLFCAIKEHIRLRNFRLDRMKELK